MKNHSRRPLLLRAASLGLASSMLWSFTLFAPVGALAAARRAAAPPSAVNGLALALSRLRVLLAPAIGGGAGSGGAATTVAIGPEPGPNYPWGASAGGTNTGNGNKLTRLPLVSWAARGGLPVGFTLSHNSQSTGSAEVGPKWLGSYDISLDAPSGQSGGGGGGNGGIVPHGTSPGGVKVHWGDGLAYAFTQNGDGSFTAATGLHDVLTVGSTFYDLTRPDQTTYRFENPNGTAWVCTAIHDENGSALTIAHNTADRVTGVTDPTGRALGFGYVGGRLATVTDPLGRAWALAYDGAGDLRTVTFPAVGGVTHHVAYEYNAAHDITAVTDPRGGRSVYAYNSGDGLVSETDNAGNGTLFAYAASGTTVTDANNHATVYTYDAAGRVVQVMDAAGQSEHYAYDADNNKKQVQDKRGKSWNYTYNGGGDLLTAKDPLLHTTTCTYNVHHKLLTKTLPGGESVACAYDGSDNLTGTQEKNSGGTTLATTTYDIGSYGLVSTKTDANGHTTYYEYDANGDLALVTTPMGNETQWGHDALGAVTSRTDAIGDTTVYTRDAWERVTDTEYPDTLHNTFAYDANSNLTQFSDATGTTSRTYDADNRMLSESKDGAPVVGHTYDAPGRKGLLSTTTDAGGRVITYAYTGRDQLDTVAEAAGTTGYAYDEAGRQVGITNANGTTVAHAYDDAGRLTGVTNKNGAGAVLSSFAYAYNDDNLRTRCTETGGDTVTYGYDGQLHLSSESRTGGDAYQNSYYVDGVGNRTGQTVGGVTRTLTYDEDDELTDSDGVVYGYDADGRQTSRACFGPSRSVHHVALAYDYDGQLTSANGASFAYDALGRQTSRTAGGVTTQYQYDGGAVLTEKRGGATTAAYTYGNALLRQGADTPLFDGLGSQRTVTDSTGAVTGGQTADAFGCPVTSDGAGGGAYGFGATSGYRTEGDGAMFIDAGLVKVGCRYYDPQVGRFITRDTDLNESPYVYCDGDPVNSVDPDGHAPQKPSGHSPPRLHGVPYPWPGLTQPIPIDLSGDLGIDVGKGSLKFGGKITITIDPVKFWKYEVPLHDKRILAQETYRQYVAYMITDILTGKGKT